MPFQGILAALPLSIALWLIAIDSAALAFRAL
jgi:hypothetical protein